MYVQPQGSGSACSTASATAAHLAILGSSSPADKVGRQLSMGLVLTMMPFVVWGLWGKLNLSFPSTTVPKALTRLPGGQIQPVTPHTKGIEIQPFPITFRVGSSAVVGRVL